jgi:membrane protein YdbS with pleckstrin-like domain
VRIARTNSVQPGSDGIIVRMASSEDQLEWRTPSPRLLRLRRLEVAVPAVLVAIFLVVVGAVSGSAGAYGAAAAAAIAGLLLFPAVGRRYRSWGYAEREDDLLVRRGVLFARLSVVPYGRMQFIDVTAGPLERSLGLATVRLHTAAAATDARIPGLERDEAARLRDRLAELGEAQAAGL